MQHMKLKLAAAVTAALLSGTAMADAWTITQGATAGSTTTITQEDGSDAIQGMNVVNSGTAEVKGSQTSTSVGKLTLEQKGTTATSTQAANYLNVKTIDEVAGTPSGTAFEQEHLGTAAIELKQGAGSGNTQGVNVAKANSITNLKQTADTVTATVALEQTSGGTNVQAINSAEATAAGNPLAGGAIGTLEQSAATAVTGTTVLKQESTGTNTQAVNRAVAATTIGTLTQTSGKDGVGNQLTQTSGGGTQALNMAIASHVTTSSSQTAKGGANMKQGVTAAGTDAALTTASTQAGNYLKATSGVIETATQNLSTGDIADVVSLTQKAAFSGSIQAGNLIDVSASGAGLNSGTQNLGKSGSTADMTLSQTGASASSLQAGNAVLTGANTATATGGSTLGQTAHGFALAMTQTGSNNSFQAVNYLGTAPQ